MLAGKLATSINLAYSPGTATVVAGRVVKLDAAKIADLDISGTGVLVRTPNVVRIVGNGGLDGDLATLGDNRPYLIGLNNANLPLADGSEFRVPQATTVMVDGGALFKMRKANLDAGTTSATIDRRAGAIQVLGTPADSVFLRSLRNDSVGRRQRRPRTGGGGGRFRRHRLPWRFRHGRPSSST